MTLDGILILLALPVAVEFLYTIPVPVLGFGLTASPNEVEFKFKFPYSEPKLEWNDDDDDGVTGDSETDVDGDLGTNNSGEGSLLIDDDNDDDEMEGTGTAGLSLEVVWFWNGFWGCTRFDWGSLSGLGVVVGFASKLPLAGVECIKGGEVPDTFTNVLARRFEEVIAVRLREGGRGGSDLSLSNFLPIVPASKGGSSRRVIGGVEEKALILGGRIDLGVREATVVVRSSYPSTSASAPSACSCSCSGIDTSNENPEPALLVLALPPGLRFCHDVGGIEDGEEAASLSLDFLCLKLGKDDEDPSLTCLPS